MNKKAVYIVVGALALVVFSATAAAYVTKSNLEADEAQKKAVASAPVKKTSVANNDTPWRNQPASQPRNVQPAQPVKQACNDSNILGTAAGGLAGGVLGHQLGKGNGKTLATVGGAVGGAYLGNQYIPLHNTTCRN